MATKKLLIFGIIFLLVFSISAEAVEASWYNDLWNWLMDLFGLSEEEAKAMAEEMITPYYLKEQLEDGTFNGIFSPQPIFVPEDGGWVKREEARSLKDKKWINEQGEEITLYSCNVDSDDTHLMDCVDFNITSIEFNLNYDRDNLKEYEFELEEGKLKTKFKIIEYNEITDKYDNETEIQVEIEETNSKGINYKYEGNPLGKTFKFGNHSSTANIEVNTSDGFADAHHSITNPDTNYGTATVLYIGVDATYNATVWFNSTYHLCPNQKVCSLNFLSFGMDIYGKGATCDTNVRSKQLTILWNETNATYNYNNQTPDINWNGGSAYTNETYIDIPFVDKDNTWFSIDFTGLSALSALNESHDNLGGINQFWYSLGVPPDDDCQTWSREGTEPYSYNMTWELANAAPTTPILNAPENNTISEDDSLIHVLNWSNSTDADGDAIIYYLEVWNSTALANILYLNSSINETTNTTGDIVTFPNQTEDYYWRVLASDGTDNSSWSDVWNFTINTTFTPNRDPNNLQIVAPSPANNTITTNNTHTFNCSATDPDGDTIYYEIYLDTNNPPTTVFSNETAATTNVTDDGNNWWRCRAVDEFGGASPYSEIRYLQIDNSTIKNYTSGYSLNTTEGTLERFEFNVSYNPNQLYYVDAKLVYQNVHYSLTQQNLTDALTRFYTNLNIPSVTSDPTVTEFYLNVTDGYANGSIGYETSTNYTQTVDKISVSQCDGVTNDTQALAVNFTFWDETGFTRMLNITENVSGQADLDATFIIYANKTVPYINSTSTYSITNETEVDFCISPPWQTFTGDATIQYVASTYDYRFYFFHDAEFNNKTQNISLYLLEITLADLIEIQVKDSSGRAISNAYVYAERYDIGSNQYHLVAMGRTDDIGKAFIYLRKNDAWYKFKVIAGTETVYLDEEPRIIGENEIELVTIGEGGIGDELTRIENIDWLVTNNSNHIILTYTDTTGVASENCLTVIQRNTTYNAYRCQECQTAASGTISCNIGTEAGDYIWGYYSSASANYLVGSGILSRIDNVLYLNIPKEVGLFATLFIILTLGLIGVAMGKVSSVIIFTLFGLLVVRILGVFYEISWLVYMGLVVAGVTLIVLSRS